MFWLKDKDFFSDWWERLSRFVLSEEFELPANSLGADIETHGKLIVRTLIYLTVNSQDDSHCELAVSFL